MRQDKDVPTTRPAGEDRSPAPGPQAHTLGTPGVPGLRPGDEEHNQGLRWALAVAISVHAVLFLVHLPKFASTPRAQAQEVKVYQVERFEVRHEPRPTEVPPQVRALKVPVPDPTPDGPEPIRQPEIVKDWIDMPDLDLDLGRLPAPPPPPVVGPIPVAGDVRGPERVYAPPPGYTEMARRVRKEGFVVLKAVIDVQGAVTDVEVVRPLPFGLTESAVEAVQRWTFKPATLNGKPVAVYFYLTVHFELE